MIDPRLIKSSSAGTIEEPLDITDGEDTDSSVVWDTADDGDSESSVSSDATKKTTLKVRKRDMPNGSHHAEYGCCSAL